MRFKSFLTWLFFISAGSSLLFPIRSAQARPVQPAPAAVVSPYELIAAMNTLRMANGLPALLEDPIINAVAQATAETMAASQMSWHIGDVRGRLAAAGYGGGGTVWATENFAVGLTSTIDEIMVSWSDADHMLPAVTAAYCHVGAGAATAANGRTYYILQAAYVAGQACGSSSVSSTGATSGSTPQAGVASTGAGAVSQWIAPVKLATPDAEGKIYHLVQAGQSFWSIAIAYQITIADLEKWNNLNRATPLKAGQKLFIPGKNTVGYATPTPEGMIVRSTPGPDGQIWHEVQAYQALITISQAYGLSVDRVLALNGLQPDWPLQIGQKLLIDPGQVTPSATLSALQKLTPEADGKYYHTVQSGQTLSWIASRYQVSVESLLIWNGLADAALIRSGQKLLLVVTPPPTLTPTPAPPTLTPVSTPTLAPTPFVPTPTVVPVSEAAPSTGNLWLILGMAAVILGLGGLAGLLLTRKNNP